MASGIATPLPDCNMELRQLRYFVAIVDYASISKAANHLFVAQPALSQQMHRLEDELRVRLLDRGSRGVTPTDAGRRLYVKAREMLANAATLGDLARNAEDNPVGEVRFGMSGTVSELVSVPLIEAARRRFPGVRIRPVEAMSGYVLEWLRRGEVDLALVYAVTDPRGVQVHHVLTEQLYLFGQRDSLPCGAAPDSAIALADVLTLDLITPALGHGLRDLIENAALTIQVPVVPRLEVDSYSQIKRLGELGAGYGILPAAAIAGEVRGGRLHCWPIEKPMLSRRIYLTYLRERPLTAAARTAASLAWNLTRQLVLDRIWPAELAPGNATLDLSS